MPSPLVVSRTLPALVKKAVQPALVQVEDRRTFHPDQRNRPAKTISGRTAPITVGNRPRKKPETPGARLARLRFGPKVHSQTKGHLTFAVPSETIVCLRRKRRKEVIFAKNKAGKGSRKPNRTRSWLSKISCR